jgi:hypothetical protein
LKKLQYAIETKKRSLCYGKTVQIPTQFSKQKNVTTMASEKEYTEMTLEELVSEEQKLKSQKTFTAAFVGFFIGVGVFAAVSKGSITPLFIWLFAYLIGKNYADKVKKVRAEIESRGSV